MMFGKKKNYFLFLIPIIATIGTPRYIPKLSKITPMPNDITSESEVLGLGLSVIALNLGMYVGAPAIMIIGIRKKF